MLSWWDAGEKGRFQMVDWFGDWLMGRNYRWTTYIFPGRVLRGGKKLIANHCGLMISPVLYLLHSVLCSALPPGPVQQNHVPDPILRRRRSQRVLAGPGCRHQPRVPGLCPGPQHQWKDNRYETLAIRESSQWCWRGWVQWRGVFNQWLTQGCFLFCWNKWSEGPGLGGGRGSLCFWPGFPLFLCTLLLLGLE